MKSDLQFLPTPDPNKFQLHYSAKLDDREKRLLKPCGSIQVDFTSIPVDFEMSTREGKACELKRLSVQVGLLKDDFLDLSQVWTYLVFNAADLRKAYVLARNIQITIENAIILHLPQAPMVGFTKSWDVRFELPKDLASFEAYRRSILVRGGI